MKRLLTLIFALLVTPASAGESLLVEFGWDQPNPVTLPGTYKFTPENGTIPDFVQWVTDVNSLPFSEVASPSIVEGLDRVLTAFHAAGVLRLSLYNAGQNVGDGRGPFTTSVPFTNAFTTSVHSSANGMHWNAWAGNANDGLYGYRITRAERTITAQGQTVYLYGVHVSPEPGAFVLVVIAVAHLVSGRFRRSL